MDQFDKKRMFQTLTAVLLLGIIAYFLHPYFQQWSLFQMKDVKVQSVLLGTAFKLKIMFSVAFAFIPLLFFAVIKLMKITEQRQKIFTVAAIFITGIIFWQVKINSLNLRYEELMQVKYMKYYFALEDLNLELYLLLGFIIGAVLGAIGLYRFNKRNA